MTTYQTQDELPPPDAPGASRLIAAMNEAAVFGHPVRRLRLVETHISWILLTGDFAYKIKKPVDFGFLDFSTLDKRAHYCAEELRLNRRFAPQIYLEVVEIRGSESRPRIGGDGEVIEYALKMREFPQLSLLSRYADERRLDADIVDAIADEVSAAHAASPSTDADSDYGSAARVQYWCNENIQHIADAIPAERLPQSYFELERWYQEPGEMPQLIEARRRDGFVRECHGDLHLGNMALLDGRVTLFDCIEFNPELRWIDTVSEAAFVAMDLHARDYPELGWRFLNRYFEQSGDYGGIALLRYYFVYRALVRAKVEALRVAQREDTCEFNEELLAPALRYLDLAAGWAARRRPGLIVMHGLSGSGKSTVAARLVEALGAIRIRSDVERKRLHGFDAGADTGSGLAQGIYSAAATAATYRRLAELAASVIAAGYTAIVDATFLKQSERLALLELDFDTACKRLIIDCQAPVTELRRRIAARSGDASEATFEVLERQLATCEPPGAAEQELARLVVVGPGGLDQPAIDEIRGLLFE